MSIRTRADLRRLACDALIALVVDWQALDEMAEAWLDAHGLDHREPCGCTARPPPERDNPLPKPPAVIGV